MHILDIQPTVPPLALDELPLRDLGGGVLGSLLVSHPFSLGTLPDHHSRSRLHTTLIKCSVKLLKPPIRSEKCHFFYTVQPWLPHHACIAATTLRPMYISSKILRSHVKLSALKIRQICVHLKPIITKIILITDSDYGSSPDYRSGLRIKRTIFHATSEFWTLDYGSE